MARKKPRPYGTGIILELERGLAIRWWETAVGADGNERRVMKYENLGKVTKRDAEIRLAERLQEFRRRGPQLPVAIPTFAEVAARYARDILPNYEKFSTRSGRASLLHRHLIPRFGLMRISDMTPAAVQRFFTELRESGFDRKGERQEYAAHTLSDIRGVLRSVMKSAGDWYGVANPVVGVKLPRLKSKRRKWALTAEQAGALIGRLKGKSKVMVALAITAGLRRGELLALRVRDLAVRIEADGQRFGLVTIAQASYRGQIGTPKTEAGLRTIELHAWVFGLIEEWLTRARKRNPNDFVFGTRTNRLENDRNILRRHVYPACDVLGVEHATWLTLRRTFQTFAHNIGIPARTIADIVGHSDVGTQFIYIQSEPSMKRVAADKIGDQLCKIVQDLENEGALKQPAPDAEVHGPELVN